MAKMSKEAGQSLQCLSVIFDNQNTQALARLVGSLCPIVSHLEPSARANCTRIGTSSTIFRGQFPDVSRLRRGYGEPRRSDIRKMKEENPKSDFHTRNSAGISD